MAKFTESVVEDAALSSLEPLGCAMVYGPKPATGDLVVKEVFRPVLQHPSHIAKNHAMTRLAAALALLLSLAVSAADWPQFRGPNRDSVWTETGILQTFPAKGLKVRWRAPVGPGWSSPVVVRGRVYLTDMRLAQPRAWERIQCFKESNGKRLIVSRAAEICRRTGE